VRPVTPPILAEIPQTDLDPAGFVYADTRSVTDDQGAATDPSNRGQPLGTTVDTSRTLYVGDRVVLRCWANDSHGRGGSAGGCIPRAVAGNSRCVATGSNSPGSCSRGRSGIAPTAFGTRNPQEQTSVSAWLRILGTTVIAAPTKRVMTDGSSSTTACNPSPRMPEPAGGGGPTNSAGSARPVAHRPRQSDDVSPDRRGVETVTRR